MLLSLILPVYNVEAFLGKCLDSCLRQDLPKSEYEIIVVIDGSPDNSIEVAKKYQKENDNIKIILRDNGGLSAARNTGLAAAVGDFVWFIDSDDYIKENILADIASRLIDNQLDSLWLDWQNVDEDGNVLPPFAPHIYHRNLDVMSGKKFMANVLSNYLYAWSFIFRRSFVNENNLLFTEGMFYEDTDFAFRSLPVVQRIQFYDKVCYNYLQRQGSIVHYMNKRKLEDICKNCISATKALHVCDKSLKRFYQVCFTSYYMLFLKEVIKSKNKEYAIFLITQTKKFNFGKVSFWGNVKTKVIGIMYNILGVSMCVKIFFNGYFNKSR